LRRVSRPLYEGIGRATGGVIGDDQLLGTVVILKEAKELARKQVVEFGVTMIVVKDVLSENHGGFECCAEMYRSTLFLDHHNEFSTIVGRC
jgi:hypothetical protein